MIHQRLISAYFALLLVIISPFAFAVAATPPSQAEPPQRQSQRIAEPTEAQPSLQPICAKLLDENLNANTSIVRYSEPANRSLEQVSKYLNFDAAKIKGTDVVFDSGSGMSIASLEIAFRTGAKVIAVNKQDYWGPIRAKVLRTPVHELFDISTLDNQVLLRLDLDPVFRRIDFIAVARAMGFKLSDFDTWEANTRANRLKLNTGATEILNRLVHILELGRFEFIADYSELVLARLPEGHVNFYFDMWGAYPYSATRLQQLSLIYRVLAKGGVARIYIPHTAASWVTTRAGKRVDLIDYLVQLNANIFSVEKLPVLHKFDSKVLVINKVASVKELILPLEELQRERSEEVFSPYSFEFTEN